MKIRNGFVSNSSSSSFIVINGRGQLSLPLLKSMGDKYGVYHIGENGHTDFGWEQTKYSDTDSKINFAYLQAARYVNLDKSIEWLSMLNDSIKRNTGATAVMPMYDQGYIDHQSCASEGSNTEMFNSPGALDDFLFGEGSYIQGDNDNH